MLSGKRTGMSAMCHQYELVIRALNETLCVMVLCSDCETGNKSAFEKVNEELEKGTIDPQLEMLCILPDCPYVGKSIKAAFFQLVA